MARVTIWNEYRAEEEEQAAREHYPDGMHTTIADALADRGHETRTATLDDPEHGLTDEVIAETDVLLWWGHRAHDEVDEAVVDRVVEAVREEGMGFVPLHSAHMSRPFRRLMGTGCMLKWREVGERERLWVVDPSHQVVDGLDDSFVVPDAEMYGEPFDVPEPDRLVLVSWFEGGEVFRSGCAYRRGRGRIFYFRPGHETYPVFHQDEIQQVIDNAVRWAAPGDQPPLAHGNSDPVE